MFFFFQLCNTDNLYNFWTQLFRPCCMPWSVLQWIRTYVFLLSKLPITYNLLIVFFHCNCRLTMTQIENRPPCLKTVRFAMEPADTVQPANSLSYYCWHELISRHFETVWKSLSVPNLQWFFIALPAETLPWWTSCESILLFWLLTADGLLLVNGCNHAINVMPCSQPTQTLSTFTKPMLKVTTIFVSLLCAFVCLCMPLCLLVCTGKKIREKCSPVAVLFCWVKGWEKAKGRGSW